MIELSGVRFSYGGPEVLRGVTLSLEGAVAVVGPNGSGKTTLLKVAAGLLRPSRGRVLVDGLDLWGPRRGEARSGVVYVHERPIVLRGTALDNVAYGLRVRGAPDAEERALAAMEALGIDCLAREEARSLSAGQRQMVCLARALAVSPRHLLLDEPTANLDSENRRRVEEVLSEFPGVVVVATHDRLLALRLAERAVLLEGGGVRAVGPPSEIV